MDSLARERLLAVAVSLAGAGHLRAAARMAEMADEVRADPRVTALIARLLLDAGDAKGAAEQLDAGASTHGWDSTSRYLAVIAAGRTDQTDRALGFARELAGDPAARAQAHIMMVDLLLRSGDIEGARDAGEAVVRSQPGNPEGLLALARVARRQGRTDEQLSLIEQAWNLQPDDPAVRTARGIALLDTGARGEGQRELARVVAEKPEDQAATHALLGSSITSKRTRLALFASFCLVPLIAIGIVALFAVVRGEHLPQWTTSLYFGLLLAVVMSSRVIDRVRTDRSVLAIKGEAYRRIILEGARLPSLRPLRWLVLASLAAMWTVIVLTGTFTIAGSMASRVAGFFVLGVPASAVFGGSAWMWKRRRKQIARGEPRSFNPSSCRCRTVATLAGRRASAYARRHLRPEFQLVPGVVDQYRCGLLGVRWVRFTELSGLRESDFPVLFRIGTGNVPKEPLPDVPGTGFYL